MKINLEKLDLVVDILMFQLIREELTKQQKNAILLQKKKAFIEKYPIFKKYKNQILGMSDDFALLAWNLIKKIKPGV